MISLLVATKNRTVELKALLDSLRRQTCRDFEILIGDQNAPGFLDEVLREFTDLPIYRLRLDVSDSSRSRNMLIEKASHDLIAFPDDDCVYESDTIEKVLAFFEAYPDAGGILCQWQPPEVPFVSQATEKLSRYHVFYKGETYVQFYRRNVIGDCRFDPDFGVGTVALYKGAEDTDFLLQIMAKGTVIYRDYGIRVRHPSPNLVLLNADKWQQYAKARMILLKKHKFPLWFKFSNLLYPLARIPLEKPGRWHYRLIMFRGRLNGMFTPYKRGN